MNTRLTVYVVVLLAILNAAVLVSLILDFGRGQVWSALGKLLVLALLDALGTWLLRALREQ